MSADWVFDLPLDAAGREQVLSKLRVMLRDIPRTSSSVAEPVAAFESQVAAGMTRIRLPLGRCDLFGLIHLSHLMSSLSPPNGLTRCAACGGSGDVPVPPAVMGLAGSLLRRYNLHQMTDPEISEHLGWPADRDARERILAESAAETARQVAARQRAEANVRVLPGTLAEGEPTFEDAGARVREFFPARGA